MSRKNVHEDYEHIAKWFDMHRSRDLGEPKYLDLLIKEKPAGKILDFGCGMGEPIASYLLTKGQSVVGVDGSTKLIGMAKSRFPHIDWICSDMREYEPTEKFGAILAWHSLFHLRNEDQSLLIPKFADWLNPGGVLLFTSGTEKGEILGNNGDVDLYHASLDPSEYRNLLELCGFEVIVYNLRDADCGDATVWMAKKK